MKKKHLAAGTLCLMIFAGMIGCTAVQQKPTVSGIKTEIKRGRTFAIDTLNINLTASENSSAMEGAKAFQAYVEKATDGKLKVRIYPNYSLTGGDKSKGLEMVMSGAADIDISSNLLYANKDAKFSVVSLPFLFKDLEEGHKSIHGRPQEILTELARKRGIELLGIGEAGFTQLSNSIGEVRTAQDLAGLTVRTPNNPVCDATFSAFGARHFSIDWADTYEEIKSGNVNAQDSTPETMKEALLHNVQGYMTLWNNAYECIFFGMNKNLYNSYHEEIQKILKEAGAEAARVQTASSRERNEKALNKMVQQTNMMLCTPTPEERQTFIDATLPVRQSLGNLAGEEMMQVLGIEKPAPPPVPQEPVEGEQPPA